jgi:chromosome segregation ATPase
LTALLAFELIFVDAIAGMIGITIYLLYLMDKMMSRIEALEMRPVKSSTTVRAQKRPEMVEEALRQSPASLKDQIGAINEILESTGRDIDSINSKISISLNDIAVTSEKIDATEKRVSENKRETASIQSEISALMRKLEQLEKETEMLMLRQEMTDEF